MTKGGRWLDQYASRLWKEYYLPHVILKISRNNDVDDHVLGTTF
jgi:hypothetical protein